jgi:hypothetical protein
MSLPIKPLAEPHQCHVGGIRRLPRLDLTLLIQGQLFTQKQILRCQR